MSSLPIDDLPPGVARPVQWRRLFEHLKILDAADPALVLDAAYSVGDSIGGMSDERHLRRLLASPEGRALVRSGVSLVDALADHGALAALPAHSLGRRYLEFSQHHDLDIHKLLESQHAMSRDYAKLDPTRQWLSDRLTVMHDLIHVLAGYDATTAGESALMGFSLPQRINDRALPIFVVISVLSGKLAPRNAVEAIRRGARAVYLPGLPLEQFLPQPLDEVRKQLRITPPRAAHARIVTPGMLIPEAA